jgi:hypothetical protein
MHSTSGRTNGCSSAAVRSASWTAAARRSTSSPTNGSSSTPPPTSPADRSGTTPACTTATWLRGSDTSSCASCARASSTSCSARCSTTGSPRPLRKALAVLSSMLGQAVVWDRIDANPVRGVRKPSGRRRKVIHPLSVLDVERLIWHLRDAGDQRSAILVELIAYTGARPQDALALAFTEVGERIHFAFKVVDGQRVPGTKTGVDRTRSVEALPTLRRDLLAYRAAMPDATAQSLVIPRDDGRPWHDHDYKNWGRKAARGKVRKKDGARTGQPGPFQRARAAAGLPDDVPRITCATRTRHCGSLSSDFHRRRSPRSSGTRSRCWPITTRMSSASTPARARSTPRSSSRSPQAQRGRRCIAADGAPNGRQISQQRWRVNPQLASNIASLQVILAKPTGGLEPPTPSLRVNPSRHTRGYRCARQRAHRLHRPRIRSDASRRAYALIARLKDPGRTPGWSRHAQTAPEGRPRVSRAGIYIPALGRSLPPKVVRVLLEDRRLHGRLICDSVRCCPHCADSMLASQGRPHAVRARAGDAGDPRPAARGGGRGVRGAPRRLGGRRDGGLRAAAAVGHRPGRRARPAQAAEAGSLRFQL